MGLVAGPAQPESKGKTVFLQHRAGSEVYRQPSFPNPGLAWMRSGRRLTLSQALYQRRGEMPYNSDSRGNSRKNFLTSRHTLWKQAAEGGGGPLWRRPMSRSPELRKRGVEAGRHGMTLPLGLALGWKVMMSSDRLQARPRKRLSAITKRKPLPLFLGTLTAPVLPSDSH